MTLSAEDLTRRIVEIIEKDFTDRRGLRQAWEEIDDETQEEIRDKWIELIKDELNKDNL